MKILIERLRQYSESLVAYKLGADFADAVEIAADMLENAERTGICRRHPIESVNHGVLPHSEVRFKEEGSRYGREVPHQEM